MRWAVLIAFIDRLALKAVCFPRRLWNPQHIDALFNVVLQLLDQKQRLLGSRRQVKAKATQVGRRLVRTLIQLDLIVLLSWRAVEFKLNAVRRLQIDFFLDECRQFRFEILLATDGAVGLANRSPRGE